MEQTDTPQTNETPLYRSMIEVHLQALGQAIDADNQEAFHQGFIQGAEGFAYLLGQGMTPDEALAACRNHQFIKLFQDDNDSTELP